IITRIVKRNKFHWDDILLERKVFQRLSHIVPVIIIYSFSTAFPDYQEWIERGAIVYFIVIALVVVNTSLNAADDIYRTYEISKVKPIKGFIQVIKIVVGTIGIILVIA